MGTDVDTWLTVKAQSQGEVQTQVMPELSPVIPMEHIADPSLPDLRSQDAEIYQLHQQLNRLQEAGPTVIQVPAKDSESGFSKQIPWFVASIVVGLILTKYFFKKR